MLEIKGDSVLALRDHAIMELLYSSGLRFLGLTNLNLYKINLQENMLRALGKGNKVRGLPIESKAATSFLYAP